MRTIRPNHLNRRIRHRPLEATSATPLCLLFQCMKEPPVMMSYAIVTFNAAFLSYVQLRLLSSVWLSSACLNYAIVDLSLPLPLPPAGCH